MSNYTDKLTDGTVTVDLAGVDFTRLLNDYQQQMVEKDEYGRYPDVSERVGVNWMGSGNVSRAAVLGNLRFLGRKASEWHSGRRRKDGPVWREIKSVTETTARYAIVSRVAMPALSGAVQGAQRRGVDGVIEITREGVWREASPLTAGTLVVDGVEVWNKEHSTNKHYVTIGSGDVDGDVDGLLHIRMHNVADVDNGNVIVAKRSGDDAVMDGTPMHFYAADATFNRGTLSNDTDTPGGKKLSMSAANLWDFTTVSWTLANPAEYEGQYLLYVVGRAVNASDDDFEHVQILYDQINDDREVSAYGLETFPGVENYLARIFVGRIHLPQAVTLPGKTYTGSQLLRVNFHNKTSGSATTFDLHEVFLVPVDEGVVEVGDLDDGDMVIDGRLGAVYHVDGSDDDVIKLGEASLPQQLGRGNHVGIGASAERDTRLYFYRYYFNLNRPWEPYVIYPPSEMDVSVRLTSRWAGVRDD